MPTKRYKTIVLTSGRWYKKSGVETPLTKHENKHIPTEPT